VIGTEVTAVLWDIDGTLLTSGGVIARTFLEAVEVVSGSRPNLAGIDFGGRLDPEIASLLLASAGHDHTLVAEVLAHFEALVAARETAMLGHVMPLPGVLRLLSMLAELGVPQTVVTGNLRSVGMFKLRAAGLVPPIDPDVGGFGDSGNGHERATVAQFALDQLTGAGWRTTPQTCWIIGDTPRDLACAQALGLRCALVATGRHSLASLAELGADVVFPDLSEHEPALQKWLA
jgi:phosphoglycolate phosphatase